jgi:iron complex transport system substrate-binding protein
MLTRVVCVIALVCASVVAGAGTAAQTPARSSRIVSLVPAVTEMLFALGAGDRVVAVSSFDRYPPEAERLPRVGALLDPDVERILSLRPDLVVVYHSQKDLMAQLGRAGIPAFPYTHSGLADVTTTIRRLGDRIGSGQRGEQLATKIETRIGELRRLSAGRRRPRTLVVFGRDAFALRGIFASGGRGFVHDMVTAAGADNVFADADRESVQATSETIIARRPDVILELRADAIDGATEAKELRTWAALSSVPAVRQGRVHILADPRTVIPGPRVAEGIEVFWKALHGAR